MDLYFERHDGHAVTCDDFLAAMADANKTDLKSVGTWYALAFSSSVLHSYLCHTMKQRLGPCHSALQCSIHSGSTLLHRSLVFLHSEPGPWQPFRLECCELPPRSAWSLLRCPRNRAACRYEQAGTPSLHVSTHYDPSARTFTIKTKQQTPDTPGQKGKKPVMLPLALGLLSKDGHEMPLHLKVQCLFVW